MPASISPCRASLETPSMVAAFDTDTARRGRGCDDIMPSPSQIGGNGLSTGKHRAVRDFARIGCHSRPADTGSGESPSTGPGRLGSRRPLCKTEPMCASGREFRFANPLSLWADYSS